MMAAPTTIRWNADTAASCAAWARHDDVCDFMILCKPAGDLDLDANESELQQVFQAACGVIAKSGRRRNITSVQAFTHHITLDQIHGGSAWAGSVPDKVYRRALDCTTPTSNASKTSRSSMSKTSSGTSRSIGPLKPDLMIAVKFHSALHPVWVSELKFVTYAELGKPEVWEQRHREGLAQVVWYLFASNDLCGAEMGLLLVNGRFQRLFARRSNGRAGGTNSVLFVEVSPGSETQELQDGFDDYVYGEEAIPNNLPADADLSTDPDTSTYRLWDHLVTALRIAESRAIMRPCNGGSTHLPEDTPIPDFPEHTLRLRADAKTMENVLEHAPTFKRARRKVAYKVAKESQGGRTDKTSETDQSNRGRGGERGRSRGSRGGGGKGDRAAGGGRGGNLGGRGGDGRAPKTPGTRTATDGAPDAVFDNDGSWERHSEIRRADHWGNPQSAPPLTPSPEQKRLVEHAPGEFLEAWLHRQYAAAGLDSPVSSARSENGKTVEQTFDADEMGSSISQRNDTPILQMDQLALAMRQYGWKFKFVSPAEMDVEMRMVSAAYEHAAKSSAAGIV